MLESVTIDQLRMFIATAETRSFSAAGRRLGRAQSVVSQAVANLESQLGVALFSRDGRSPELTRAGEQLLADARIVTASLAALKARARGMAGGDEPELSVSVDVMFPMSALTHAAAGFGEAFPLIPLRLYVEALGGVAKAVLDGLCQIGVIGSLPLATPALVTERLLGVEMIFVTSPSHPLAGIGRPLTECDLAQHVQLVLTDRTDLSEGRQFGVHSPRNWRLADLGAKHAFLLAGLGWGGMPVEMVARDMKEGSLVQLTLQDAPRTERMTMSAAYRHDNPPGPAGRWFIEELKRFTAGSRAGGAHRKTLEFEALRS